MPFFGGKEKVQSIRDVKDWEKAMRFLTERIGEEYEVAMWQLPLGIFGKSEFEILRDKKHYTSVYPSSLNERAKFRGFLYFKESLGNLDVAFAPDGTGTQVVGARKNFVNRRFVDPFVDCMSDVYNSSWERMHVWISGNVRAGPCPVFLVSEPLAMSVAPYIFENQHLEPTGKYQPVPTGSASN